MTVVVTGAMTGALEKLSRNEMNELIERAGGRSSSSVSKKTALVVAGEGAGSKRAKAQALGIRLATADEFAALVADHLAQPAPAPDSAEPAESAVGAVVAGAADR
jgi:DNA ligase (NAD+)